MSFFGGSKSVAPAPTIIAPPPMPIPDDETVKRAKKKSLAGQRARSGRASTILTDDVESETLG